MMLPKVSCAFHAIKNKATLSSWRSASLSSLGGRVATRQLSRTRESAFSGGFRLLSVKAKGSSTAHNDSNSDLSAPNRIAIVGGGLAGLSTAFHLLERSATTPEITIFDRAQVGTGGASSVAGGLLHPLSPRGKLVYLGLEGLASANRLIDEAIRASSSNIILRKELYRVATSQEQQDVLQQTARDLSEFCEWLEPRQLPKAIDINATAFGGLRLHHGCKVLHVPSYLQGLFEACQEMGNNVQWKIVKDSCRKSWKQRLESFDTVVLSAGSGLFIDDEDSSLLPLESFPVQLVRGQSIEMVASSSSIPHDFPAVLCGKYISPVSGDNNRILVGATHEFDVETPWSRDRVVRELRERTRNVAPWIWNNDEYNIDHFNCGWRVQSKRSKYGRLPLIGKLLVTKDEDDDSLLSLHPHAWIFTGLSSRGLLYHGVFGEFLVNAMLGGNDETLPQDYGKIRDSWKETNNNNNNSVSRCDAV